MRLRKTVVKAVLFLSFLSLVLVQLPQSSFTIPEAQAQYEGITFDAINNIVTFNQNSSSLFNDLYGADTTNNLTLLTSTQRFRFQNYDASRTPTYLDQTQGANNDIANDMFLVPNNPVAVGDEAFWGNEDRKFSVIWVNVTTAGVYTSAITWYYSTSTGWLTISVTQSPNPVFKSTGVGYIRFTPPTAWAKRNVNGITAYWIKARITTAGTVTTQPLGGRSWLSYKPESNVRPAESLDLPLQVIVTSYSTSGTVLLEGYDRFDNIISETITVNSATTYTTTKRFKSLYTDTASAYEYAVKVSGEFTFYIQQNRWGAIAYGLYYGTEVYQDSYTLLSALKIGDGTTVIDVSDSNKQLYIGTYTSTQSSAILVKANAKLTFGVLRDLATKSVYGGLQIRSSRTNTLESESNAEIYLYDTSIQDDGGSRELWFAGSEHRLWGVTLSAKVQIRNGLNLDIDNLWFNSDGTGIPFYPYTTSDINGTFNKIAVSGASYFFYQVYRTAIEITFRNIVAKNTTTLLYVGGLGVAQPNFTFVDTEADWNFKFSSVWTGEVYRKYSFDLTVTYPNGTAFPNANVTLTYSGQGGGTVGSWLTDSNGQITTQTLTMGFYNQTGGNTLYDYNPYTLTITKSGYQTYTKKFTLNEKTDWEVALTPITQTPEFNSMQFMLLGSFFSAPIMLAIALHYKKHQKT